MISDERFRKREHILKTGEFRKIYKRGVSYKRDGLVIYAAPNGLNFNRLGFSISSSALKLAIRRNRIRRIIREAYRLGKGEIKPGYDLIVSVKKGTDKPLKLEDARSLLAELTRGVGVRA